LNQNEKYLRLIKRSFHKRIVTYASLLSKVNIQLIKSKAFRMNKLMYVLLTFFITQTAFADHHAPQTSAVETFFCSFAEGKDMDDLLKVAGEWDAWASNNFSKDYRGYVLQSVVANDADFPFDTVWLGFANNHQAMGTINDEWMAKGGKVQKKFDSVSPCSSHSLMTAMAVKPVENMGGPGFLQISACEMNEGSDMASLMAGDKAWAAWMTDNNMPGGLFRWFTAVGEPRGSKTDFYNVYVASSMAERGQAHDMMMAGGNQALQSAYGDLATCDNPRVWYAQPVGGKSGS
jgi:hypothetical protein